MAPLLIHGWASPPLRCNHSSSMIHVNGSLLIRDAAEEKPETTLLALRKQTHSWQSIIVEIWDMGYNPCSHF
ncbi:hypothetical protein NXS19_001153 [Fusarium pseudograminearum]|nr:hypothetical protein NXS19_001153 [Fusarium pseudograminearum]